MELFSKILQIILQTALPILVTSGAGWMIGKCIELFKKLKDKNPELYEILNVVSKKAVEAAEQVFGGEQGQKKKEYAIKMIEKYLLAKGIVLDVDVIVMYIEAAVKDMKKEGGELPPYEGATE